MSAPVLFIIIPAVLGVILAVFNQNINRNRTISTTVMTLLALLGLTLPAGTAVELGPVTLKVSASLSVLGRQFTISSVDAPFIALLFGLIAAWYLGSMAVDVSRWFFPISLVIVSLLVAALASEIFLFAAPLILVAVILSVPLLSPPETAPGRGVVRYLLFQTMAMPCILLAGYILTGFETGPSDSSQALLSAVLLGVGFAFLLGVFPFNTWLPQLFEEAPVYVTAFVMMVLPMSVFWFMIHFIDGYVWIRTNQAIFQILRITGILMVLVGGVWAVFQTDLRRILAFAVMLDTGFMLLAVGSGTLAGFEVLCSFFLIRTLNIGMVALSLVLLTQKHSGLDLSDLRGVFHQSPFAVVGYLTGLLSIAGMPLLANSSIRMVLTTILGTIDPLVGRLSIVGSIGLIITFARIVSAIYVPANDKKIILGENMAGIILISAGVTLNILIALIPGILLEPLSNLLNAFIHLPH